MSVATTLTVARASTVPLTAVADALLALIGTGTDVMSTVVLVVVVFAVAVLPPGLVAVAVKVIVPSFKALRLNPVIDQVVPVTSAVTGAVVCSPSTSLATTVTVEPAETVPMINVLATLEMLIVLGTLVIATVGAVVLFVVVVLAVAVLFDASVAVAV